MQHVYWVVDIPGNDQDQIKRANLSGPADQTPEVVIFPLNDPSKTLECGLLVYQTNTDENISQNSLSHTHS